MKKVIVNKEALSSGANLALRGLSRRRFFRTAAGTGAGVIVGSTLRTARAAADQEDEHPSCPAVPRPIPHFISPPGIHVFFPGPVDTDYTTSPNTGHDPSMITDFKGVVGLVDLEFSGTGTDLSSGQSAPYNFNADMRFMKGVFVGLDNEEHHGAMGFI